MTGFNVGQPVVYRGKTYTFPGTVCGITDDGQIIVRAIGTPDGYYAGMKHIFGPSQLELWEPVDTPPPSPQMVSTDDQREAWMDGDTTGAYVGTEASKRLPLKVAPAEHVVGTELPADIIESLLAIGPVEWGVSLTQSDEKHASDLLDTLRITREHFGVTDQETAIHGVYLEGTGTVLAHTGMSPNSPQHARILAGAWNQLVEIAKAQATLVPTSEGGNNG